MRALVLLASLALAGCAGGSVIDGGCRRAACLPDEGVDGGTTDLGTPDSGSVDAGSTDLGARDLGTSDLGSPDLGPPDLGPGVGGLWMLPPPYTAWTQFDRGVGATTAYAPTEPVEEVLALDGCDEAYAITHGWYNVLRLSDHTWVGSGLRATIFPEILGARVSSAESIGPRDFMCTGTAAYDVTLLLGSDAYIYRFTKGTGFSYVRTVSDPWATDPMAPDTADVVADFFTFDNTARWVMGSPYDLCPGGPSMPHATDPYGPYWAFLTSDGHVHPQDDGYCFTFIRDVPTPAFGPFALPTAPNVADIGAAFYADSTLWVMRE